MNSFAIFAIILTTVYVIYYVIVIAHDIVNARRKTDNEEHGEDLEMPYQPIVPIEVGNPTFINEESGHEATPVVPKETPEERLERLEDDMWKTIPEYQNVFTSEEMTEALKDPDAHNIWIKRETVND